jgi:hypothetical protein
MAAKIQTNLKITNLFEIKMAFFERILRIMDFYGIKSVNSLAKEWLKYDSSEKINRLKDATKNPSYEILKDISNIFIEIDANWLITGNGEMLKEEFRDDSDVDKTDDSKKFEKKLIPLYDVATIGGLKSRVANMEGVTQPSEWIDAGDWFSEATFAIHHYDDSMIEYPSGCILVVREILDVQLLVWGKNYVIETDEYRITKRLQRSDSADFLCAYSTNLETYPDGKLIHQPIDIPKLSIRHIAMVLGYVVKEQSSGKLYPLRKH